ncbi:uncharacterized protein EV420DRAFT_1656846 [Desarmillaria tabescens]|uniref:Uncharacterized protein n=1 Tax=Armillaria tabescens TaxID=1929756 RepID=A0AA39MEV4_ARMTA|nr:uncharacterized protein EV420DRAFT_1656846 [Desarmillaria tabescens]KAK0431223.1 hypothetical protein EV420DRAFT_1656846 [Desarmillaria tabescens]
MTHFLPESNGLDFQSSCRHLVAMFMIIKLRGHIEEGSMPGEQWNAYLRAAFIPPPEIVLSIRIDVPHAT